MEKERSSISQSAPKPRRGDVALGCSQGKPFLSTQPGPTQAQALPGDASVSIHIENKPSKCIFTPNGQLSRTSGLHF